MSTLLSWLSKNKFQAYVITFLLIALPPVGLFFAAQSTGWAVVLLALVVLGNVLAILIR